MNLQQSIDRICRYDAALPKADRTIKAINALDWYAVRTSPQKEFVAKEVLDVRGFPNLLPTEFKYRRKSRYSKSKVRKEYPLMPGYIFVGFSAPPPWGFLFKLNVVRAVVGIQGEPVRILTKAIEELMRLHVSEPAERKFMRTYHEFKAGDMVRLADHTYEKPMRVENISGRRAEVLMEIFGTMLNVEVDLYDLVAA